MIEVTKYQSKDNIIFDNKKDCIEYESFLERAEIENLRLNKCNVSGGDFVQQDRKKVRLFRRFIAEESFKAGIDRDICDGFNECNNILDRYLSDSVSPIFKKLNNMAYRAQCIDNDCREFQQPYWAGNNSWKDYFKQA